MACDSSFAESFVSSDYPLPTLTLSPSASDSNIFHDTTSNAERCVLVGNNYACNYSSKNWAQQRDETNHLQVDLALRISFEAFSADNAHLLSGPSFELRAASGSGSSSKSSHLNVEAVSHRFWALVDAINLPCRISRGYRYCGRDDGSSCMVRYDNDREYLVDLIGKPGLMYEPDSFLKGPT